MSTGVHGPTRARIEEKTLRTDRWWLYPLTTFVVFTAFVIYATIRAFSGSNYYQAPYLSPFYSPCLGDCVSGSSDFGQPFGWWPLSASLIVLIFPLGFRMSCYYYRKAYYRVLLDEPARLRRRRAAHGLLRRDPAAADPQQHPPLLLVRRGRRRPDPDLRHDPGLRAGRGRVRRHPHGPGLADLPGQHRADLALHAVVPLAAATSSAAGCATSASTRSATSCGPGSPRSTSTTPATPGSPCSRSRSPTCTCS